MVFVTIRINKSICLCRPRRAKVIAVAAFVDSQAPPPAPRWICLPKNFCHVTKFYMGDIFQLQKYVLRGFVLRKLAQEEYNVQLYSISDWRSAWNTWPIYRVCHFWLIA